MQRQWEFLRRNFEAGNLAHAFLFSGQDIKSIENFTKEFVKLINCLKTGVKQTACQDCQNCKMIESGIFPDLMVVKSENSKSSVKNEKDMMEINISQIRNLQSFLGYKSYYGNFKAVIIENADRMNQEAQSCFLKTLEEPKGKTIIFLLTSKPDFLLPTIFSRCQQVKFFSKQSYNFSQDEEIILQGLKRTINSDLADKFNYVKSINLEEGNFNKILIILQKYFRQMLLAKIGITGKPPVTESKALTTWQVKNILRIIEDLSYQTGTTNINQKLALEVLLMEI